MACTVLLALGLTMTNADARAKHHHNRASAGPAFTPKAAAGTYAAEKEAVTICVRKAAFGLAKAGGDIRHAGEAAVGQCAAEEAAVGVKSGDKIYQWQRNELHDSLIHTAQIAATQARATGCGLPPGAAKDTL